MASKYHQKIKQVVKEADLPKALSEDLKKELESHFYEKEHDLRFSGLKGDEIEKQLSKDFGDEEFVAKHLNFVHKKSFYSFIKSLMKNENKPSIFNTVFLFILVFFLYQNTAWDMATQVQMANLNGGFRTFGEGGVINLGLFLILNFILILRLFKGGAISQKIVASILFIVMLGQIFYSYTLVTRSIIIWDDPANIPEHELVENADQYDEREEAEWIIFNNEKEGYSLNLPLSYFAFRSDGTSDLTKYFSPPNAFFEPKLGEIIAFGPAFSADKDRINVKVFDADNSLDKKENETWTNYYLRTQLEGKKYKLESRNGTGFFDENIVFDLGVDVILENEIQMRKNIWLFEGSNRLYAYLYDAQNPINREVLSGISHWVPVEKEKWVTYDNPNCPFAINLPDHWKIYNDDQKSRTLDYKTDCKFKGFGMANSISDLDFDLVEGTLDTYFKAQNLTLKLEGDTEWQGFPAKRLLFGSLVSKGAAFAMELEENKWLIFRYSSHYPLIDKILNSLEIRKKYIQNKIDLKFHVTFYLPIVN